MSEIILNRTNPLAQLKDFQQKAGKAAEGQEKFSEVLSNALKQVNELQGSSNQEINRILAGDMKDVHSAMIAIQKAGLSFQMLMQVRNKLVEAYQEVMRMQV
jgi:flagellar hook-basal body complex protein FliE